ncbi:MAG: hypothetical protein LQ337_002121 [Flavoplaca oasis]|nr:MAG: hypothetical protein LQ337_002121 [Flavoplaca oasis]
MAPPVQEGSVVVPAMTSASIQRPPRQRLPIIPAIPRKLEKQPKQTSSLAAGSRSATNPILEPPAQHPALGAGETQHVDSTPEHDEEDKHIIEHTEEIEEPLVEESSSIDNTANIASATGEGTTAITNMIPPANLSSPSILDPESPVFVPEASKTPTDTLDGTSSLDGRQSDRQPSYSLQTTATGSWAPYDSTSANYAISPSTQYPYATYSQPLPPYYAPTVLHKDKSTNPSIYYGYDPSRNMSFYPRSSRPYVGASPIQSSYEGYAMANTSQAMHSPTISSSHPPIHNVAEQVQGPLPYPPSHYQPQQPQPIPQFGSHFPITPSATPSNSGSQKQDPQRNDMTEYPVPAEQPPNPPIKDKDVATSKTSQKYQDWCQQILKTLQEEADRPGIQQALSDHLISNFNNPALADCELYISHVSHRFEPVVVSLHSLLIAQIAKLKALLQNAEMREDGKKQMLLNVKDQYANPAALKCAVKVCYGERPSLYTGYTDDLSSEEAFSEVWMNNALAFAAAGHLLEMTGVAHRGEQIASMVLNWNNLEHALSFAMDTTIQRVWGSATSFSSFPCNASELLLSCLYFVIGNISGTIRLDLSAKSLASINRLPTASDAPSSRSRLSRIQFGELPVEDEEPISKQDSLTSAILFSLPFDHVKFIMDRVPTNINKEIVKPVVQERERRRLRKLNALKSTDSADAQLHPSLIHEESIHESDGRLSLGRS